MNFFTRLFGSRHTVIKDPDIGKIRYLESDNGPVWSGKVSLKSQVLPVQYFIESEIKLLKHSAKSTLLSILDNIESIQDQTKQYFISNFPLRLQESYTVQFIHMPENPDRYDAELICQSGGPDFSILLHEGQVVEVILE